MVTAIPQEHTKLKLRDLTEKDRMLGLIAFLAAVANDGRGDDELTLAEQDQLETLIAGEQDRPATWAQNLLCFHYDRCVAPWSGEDGSAPKTLPQQKPQETATVPVLSLQPNPSTNWSVARIQLGSNEATATLRVLDITGKQVATYPLAGKEPQVVLDTRVLGPGAYLVELISGAEKLASEKLIVQP